MKSLLRCRGQFVSAFAVHSGTAGTQGEQDPQKHLNINVPRAKADRAELMEISGQAGIPTLVTEDGQVIADDDDAIIAYLQKDFAK